MERKGNAKWNAKGTQNGTLRERKRMNCFFQIFWGSCSRNYGGELMLANILGQNNKRDHLPPSPFAAKEINKFAKFIDDYLRICKRLMLMQQNFIMKISRFFYPQSYY